MSLPSMPLKKYKKEFEHSYTFGVFPTLELLKFRPESVIEVALSSKGAKNEGVAKLEALCRQQRIKAEVNDRLVERLAPSENSYAVGVFHKYSSSMARGKNHVVLVNPGDMGNLGTIVRTMAGFGMLDLGIVRPAADLFDPRTIRASMGALFQLRFEHFEAFDEYREAHPNNVYPFMTDGQTALHEAKLETPFALVFGSEGAGLPQHFHRAGKSVSIPQTRLIDSLNLPVAVSIALYEATRGQLKQSGE